MYMHIYIYLCVYIYVNVYMCIYIYIFPENIVNLSVSQLTYLIVAGGEQPTVGK